MTAMVIPARRIAVMMSTPLTAQVSLFPPDVYRVRI